MSPDYLTGCARWRCTISFLARSSLQITYLDLQAQLQHLNRATHCPHIRELNPYLFDAGLPNSRDLQSECKLLYITGRPGMNRQRDVNLHEFADYQSSRAYR